MTITPEGFAAVSTVVFTIAVITLFIGLCALYIKKRRASR